MTEQCVRQSHRLRDNRVPVAPAGRYCAPEIFQHLRGNLGILHHRRLQIDCNSQHATSDVASDGLRVDEVGSRDHNADAHFCCKMYIGHNRNLLNIRSAAETL